MGPGVSAMTVAQLSPCGGADLFDADAARSFTLDAQLYYDAEIFEHEKAAIFHRAWMQVGHVEEVPETGDYFTCKVIDQSLFVIRFVARFDVVSYYGTMQHGMLYQCLEKAGVDEQLRGLVRAYLQASDPRATGRGMVAGGSLSPPSWARSTSTLSTGQ